MLDIHKCIKTLFLECHYSLTELFSNFSKKSEWCCGSKNDDNQTRNTFTFSSCQLDFYFEKKSLKESVSKRARSTFSFSEESLSD